MNLEVSAPGTVLPVSGQKIFFRGFKRRVMT
jgi:hypothetical protein